MTEIDWSRLTAAELGRRAEAGAIVLVPVASTEQHGPHLGTGVDAILCTEACRRTARLVAAERPCVVAPTVWMGLAEHHMAFGGTITLPLRVWHSLLEEICRSILRAGFARICLVNGHGGNVAGLAAITTDLARDLGTAIATTSYWARPHAEGAFAKILETQIGVQHACEAETSMMLAVAPDCVRTDRMAEAQGPGRPMALPGAGLARWRAFTELTETGVLGDARPATAEKGEALLEVAAGMLAEELIAGRPWEEAPKTCC